MKDKEIIELLNLFKQSTGFDVNARCYWVSGKYYRNMVPKWQVETDWYIVDNETTLEGALRKLTQLHDWRKNAAEKKSRMKHENSFAPSV